MDRARQFRQLSDARKLLADLKSETLELEETLQVKNNAIELLQKTIDELSGGPPPKVARKSTHRKRPSH